MILIEKAIGEILNVIPHDRRTYLFSATMTNKIEVATKYSTEATILPCSFKIQAAHAFHISFHPPTPFTLHLHLEASRFDGAATDKQSATARRSDSGGFLREEDLCFDALPAPNCILELAIRSWDLISRVSIYCHQLVLLLAPLLMFPFRMLRRRSIIQVLQILLSYCVGGWVDLGVNAGLYTRELMSNSVNAIQEEPKHSIDPARVLEKAYTSTKAKGSSTACIIALTDQGLHAVNLGDSGFMVVRDECTIFKSPVQQHDFNFSYQLESSKAGDLPSSREICNG